MPQVFLDAVPNPTNLQPSGPPHKSMIDVAALSSVTLGANPITHIPPSSGLAPAICLVHLANDPLPGAADNAATNLQVQGASTDSVYYINNALIAGTQLKVLKNGDKISLKSFNGVCYYSYQVRIQETTTNFFSIFQTARFNVPSPPKAGGAASNASSPATALTNSLAHPATEECACPFCLEIQVQSTSLVPCGHAFCKECVAACTECPTVCTSNERLYLLVCGYVCRISLPIYPSRPLQCRAVVQSQIPCRTVDNIVQAMVKSNFFSADDVQVYEERRVDIVELALPVAASKAVLNTKRPTKRQRRRAKVPKPPTIAEGAGASEATAICIDD
jgi:hypothetical protein